MTRISSSRLISAIVPIANLATDGRSNRRFPRRDHCSPDCSVGELPDAFILLVTLSFPVTFETDIARFFSIRRHRLLAQWIIDAVDSRHTHRLCEEGSS
jgi:hypothetical protein